jgi:hypothetical protein
MSANDLNKPISEAQALIVRLRAIKKAVKRALPHQDKDPTVQALCGAAKTDLAFLITAINTSLSK